MTLIERLCAVGNTWPIGGVSGNRELLHEAADRIAELEAENDRLNMEMVAYRAKLTPKDVEAMTAVIKALTEEKARRATSETNCKPCSDARSQGQEDTVERTHPKATDQVGTVSVSGADKQPISPTFQAKTT